LKTWSLYRQRAHAELGLHERNEEVKRGELVENRSITDREARRLDRAKESLSPGSPFLVDAQLRPPSPGTGKRADNDSEKLHVRQAPLQIVTGWPRRVEKVMGVRAFKRGEFATFSLKEAEKRKNYPHA